MGVDMKETGMTRRVDELGRVVIPKEIRTILKIKEGTPLEIFVEGDTLLFKKYSVAENNKQEIKNIGKTLFRNTGLSVCFFDGSEKILFLSQEEFNLNFTDAFFHKFEMRQPFECDKKSVGNQTGAKIVGQDHIAEKASDAADEGESAKGGDRFK